MLSYLLEANVRICKLFLLGDLNKQWNIMLILEQLLLPLVFLYEKKHRPKTVPKKP